jgi:Mg/Co/Ni transporter MgtE
MWLKRDILDKQIVDLDGTRVVRVNDIRFGLSDNKLHVLGVDISTRGIIRRLGLGKFRIFAFLKPAFIEWDKMQIVGKSLKLTKVTRELIKLHPADLANVLETLNPTHSGELVQSLDPITVAKVFQELKPEFKRDIFRTFSQKQIEVVLSHVPVDELVDYLKTLNRRNRDKIIDHLSTNKKKEVEEFLDYPDDTAGGIMSTEFVREDVETTVAEALQNIRRLSHTYRSINYIYIIDKKDHFLGVVSLRTLISSKPTEKVGKIMKRIKMHQTVHPNADIQHVATLMTRYNLLSLAVLEKDGTLLGVVMVDDLMRQLLPHA